MNIAVEIHFQYESGLSFEDIAKSRGMSPKEVAQLYVSAKIAEDKFRNREPVVYRKRLVVKKAAGKPKVEPKKKSDIVNAKMSALSQAAIDKGWKVK